MTNQYFCLFLGVCFATIAALACYSRWRFGTFMSAAGGLHASIFLFYGLGAIAYAISGKDDGRLSFEQAVDALRAGAPCLLCGYFIASLPDIAKLASRRVNAGEQLGISFRARGTSDMLWLMTFLAWVGYLGSTSEISASGVGTIFPVLKLFLYPLLVISVYHWNKRDLSSILLLVSNGAAALTFAYFSPWRSEMLMSLAAIGLGLTFRNRRLLFPVGALGLVAFLVVFPFVQAKKKNYEATMSDPGDAIRGIYTMSLSNQVEGLVDFWAARINYAREFAYIEAANDGGILELRKGESYVEAVRGLIPRVVWPDKPAFNITTNFLLPRMVGLLSFADPTTSWGVNIYAEFLWNFRAINLLWGVPLWFFLANRIDRFQGKNISSVILARIIRITLFFQFLALVSIVNALTYFMWMFVIAKSVELYSKSVVRPRLPRTPRTA